MVIHSWVSVLAVTDEMLVAVAVSSCWLTAYLADGLRTMLLHMATTAKNHYVLWCVVVVVTVNVVDIYTLS